MATRSEESPRKQSDEVSRLAVDRSDIMPSTRIEMNARRKHDVRFPVDFPLLVNTYRFSPEYRVPENYHDYLEISLIEEGRGKLSVEDHVFPLGTGDLVIMGPNTFHTVEVSQTKSLRVISLHFLPELVFAAGEPGANFDWVRPFYDRSYLGHPIINHDRSRPVSSRFSELLHARSTPSHYAFLQMRISLLQVLLEVLRAVEGAPAEKNSLAVAGGDTRLNRVLAWMNSSFQEKLTLDDAAKVACISPQHFCRWFKNCVGFTFTEFLTRIRVAQAQRLLLQADFRATDIAYEVGFGSASYFFRAFRDVTGVTPGDFIRNGVYARDASPALDSAEAVKTD